MFAEGPECLCGGSGCLGRVASATATLQRYREYTDENDVEVTEMMELARLAREGDSLAREAIAISAGYLARATLILVNCLNPDVFVFSGGMALVGDLLIDPVKRLIGTATFEGLARRTRIVAAKLDMYSGCCGAACMAFSEARSLPGSAGRAM